jgi:hypothetical protein
VSFPPDLLDELARVFARVALEHLLQELSAREARQDPAVRNSLEEPDLKAADVDDEKKQGQYQPGSKQEHGSDMPSKPVNVKQVLVYLTHEQHATLLKLKEKLGTPASEQIRRAIDRYLKQMESRN